MLIAIDHGNYAVKTPHFSFISGLTEHTVKPPMAEEVLEYNGKYWSLTGQRCSHRPQPAQSSSITWGANTA